ncbi:MAG: hypothetical protein U0559_11230 [Anaerolineae bacterium]
MGLAVEDDSGSVVVIGLATVIVAVFSTGVGRVISVVALATR